MMNTQDTRIEGLIQELEDGTISEHDRVALMELMRADADVRERYLKHMELVSLLKQTAEDRVKLGTMPVSQDMVQAERRKGAVKAMVYGIAALLLVGAAALLVRTQLDVAPVEGPRIAFDHSNHSDLVVSRNGKDILAKEYLRVGDVVNLEHGQMRFTFSSGVEAIVEGPSRMELKSDMAVKMDGGLAWFRVPPEGVGFTVETGRMQVEDLGTEFGVWFDAEGCEQVHVGKGEVKVSARGGELVLTEGYAVRVCQEGTVNNVDFKLANFRREFKKGTPYMHWRFDALVDGGFEAEGDLSEPEMARVKFKKLFSEDPVDVESYAKEGRFGGCFSLRGDGVYGQTQLKAIGGNVPRTIAAWIRHRGDSYGVGGRTPYCSWGKRETGRLWKVFFEKSDKGVSLFTSAMYSAVRSPLSESYAEGQWVHIASVYTGRVRADGFPEVYHYINGELLFPKPYQGVTEIDTDIVSADAKPLRVGASIENVTGAQSVDGDIDELYLIRGVLGENEVRRLMQENKFE